jgi:hypothetical protein
MTNVNIKKSFRYKNVPTPEPAGSGTIGLPSQKAKPIEAVTKNDAPIPNSVDVVDKETVNNLIRGLALLGKPAANAPYDKVAREDDQADKTMVAAVELTKRLVQMFKFRTNDSGLFVYDKKSGVYNRLCPFSNGNGSFSSFVRNACADSLATLSRSVIKATYEMLVDVNTLHKEMKDMNSYLVALEDGVFDIRNKKLLPFSPRFCLLSKLNIHYIENAVLPQLVDDYFLNLGAGEEGKRQILAAIGIAVSNYRDLQKSPFFIGPARNGKSTLADFLFRVLPSGTCIGLSLADLGTTFGPGKLASAHVSIDTDLAKSKWNRGIISVFKKAVTCDRAETQDKFKPYQTTKIQTFLMFFGNSFPKLSALDDAGLAILRRIWLISTGPSVPLEEIDPDLPEHLYQSRSEILSLALDYAYDFIKEPSQITTVPEEELYLSPEADYDLLVSAYISNNLMFSDSKEEVLPMEIAYSDFLSQTGISETALNYKQFSMRFWQNVDRSRRCKPAGKRCIQGCRFSSDNYEKEKHNDG